MLSQLLKFAFPILRVTAFRAASTSHCWQCSLNIDLRTSTNSTTHSASITSSAPLADILDAHTKCTRLFFPKALIQRSCAVLATDFLVPVLQVGRHGDAIALSNYVARVVCLLINNRPPESLEPYLKHRNHSILASMCNPAKHLLAGHPGPSSSSRRSTMWHHWNQSRRP